jgi:hypothetical protein
MPTYTMKNKETGEEKDFRLSLAEREEFLSKGEWVQVITPSNFVSGAKSPLRTAGSEWGNLLTRVKETSGRNNTIKD